VETNIDDNQKAMWSDVASVIELDADERKNGFSMASSSNLSDVLILMGSLAAVLVFCQMV
jgi:hypothetical protein